MGGHAAGEIASRLAVETLYQRYYEADGVALPPAIRLEHAVGAANLSVYEQAVSNHAQSGMGTTLVAAVLHDSRVLIANVGDSRAYLIRDGEAIQITHDHSWVAEQVKLGTITPDQAQNHAYRNLVTRCLGHRPGTQVDMFEHRLRAGDTLLLCSDGLSGQVSDAKIAAVLTDQEPERGARALIDLANQQGGPDNITVVLAHILDVPVLPAPERPDQLEAKTTQPMRFGRQLFQNALPLGIERPLLDDDLALAQLKTRASWRRRTTLILAGMLVLSVAALIVLLLLR
jgi:protein phosphatase